MHHSSILGLAFPAISNLNHDPFFVTAYKQHALAENSFGFYLSQNGSELTLGGEDPKRISGQIEYHEINNSTGFWQVTGGTIFANGKKVAGVSAFETIIDSGTTIAYGPTEAVAKVWKTVNGTLFDEEQGLYSFSCEKSPKFAFNWGGKNFTISSKKYVLFFASLSVALR